MTTLTSLGAPYNYVQMEEVVSVIVELLNLDKSLSGTGSSSVYIARQKLNTNSLLELKGLGKRLWKEIDAQDYIDDLRDEWK